MIGTVIATLIVLTVGIFVGKSNDIEPKLKAIGQTTPDKWPPDNQIEMMKACAMVCGKHRVDTYDSLRGECKCLNTRNREK